MSKLALHIQHFKRGAVGGIATHNYYKRGERDTHSNQDIDPSRSSENVLMIVPETNLYQDVKGLVEGSEGRITKASIWVSEWLVYPPEELQDPLTADKEKVLEYFSDVREWMLGQGYVIPMMTVHFDESTVHAHIDTVPLTADNKLSRKEIYTRTRLNSIHTELAAHLQGKGWDIQRGDSTAAKQIRAVSVPEYKKQAEAQKQELMKDISAAKEEKADLQAEIDGLNAVLTEKEVNSIAAKKTVFGKTDIDWKDWERTRNTAATAEKAVQESAEAKAAAEAAIQKQQEYHEQMQQWQAQTQQILIADANRQLRELRAKDKEELDKEIAATRSERFSGSIEKSKLQQQVNSLTKKNNQLTGKVKSVEEQLLDLIKELSYYKELVAVQQDIIENNQTFMMKMPGIIGDHAFVKAMEEATGIHYGTYKEWSKAYNSDFSTIHMLEEKIKSLDGIRRHIERNDKEKSKSEPER